MIVIIEKPSLAQCVDAYLREAYPGEPLDYVVAHAYGMPFVFDYPRNLSWNEYPYVHLARYKRVESAQFSVEMLQLEEGARARRASVDYAQLAKGQTAIACTDQNHADIAAALRLRRYLEQQGVISEWRGTFSFIGIDDQSVKKALNNPLPEFQEFLACAQTALKADFDYSFLVNAAGLLTRCYREAGGTFENPVFSKYTIQALYALRRDIDAGLSTTEGDIIHRFQKWKGTGKHVNRYAQLGSCSSQAELLESLRLYGLVYPGLNEPEPIEAGMRRPVRKLRLTPLADAFLAKLHPDCEDADLPFRLYEWRQSPSYENREASIRYLRTWFGRQKRFMDRAALHLEQD